MARRLIELTGQRFGKLVAVECAGRNARRDSLWRCACDCGNESIVRGDVLRRGTTQSCGCGKGLKHGYYQKPWYSSYKAMMERCYLSSNGNYKRYGGKGVTVCEEWHDINKFAEWAESSGYAPGLTIDRIDSGKGYFPENCRWATKKQQSNNRKNTIFYTYKGETKALTDWASIFGINRYTLYDRIEERGWSVEKALETPVSRPTAGQRWTEKGEPMATCKDCLHYEVCVYLEGEPAEESNRPNAEKECTSFLGEAAPVVHGRWLPVIEESPQVLKMPMFFGYKCSVCGRCDEQEEPYCHCGAKMDGGKEK